MNDLARVRHSLPGHLEGIERPVDRIHRAGKQVGSSALPDPVPVLPHIVRVPRPTPIQMELARQRGKPCRSVPPGIQRDHHQVHLAILGPEAVLDLPRVHDRHGAYRRAVPEAECEERRSSRDTAPVERFAVLVH